MNDTIQPGFTLEEPKPRKGLDLADVTPLIGCVVLIARRGRRRKGPGADTGAGLMQGRLVAIAQDGAYWDQPSSLVIVADRPDSRPDRAGLVPIDLIVELTVEEVPNAGHASPTMATVNKAIDDTFDAVGRTEDIEHDFANLLSNVIGHRLDHPDDSVKKAIKACYSEKPGVVLGWSERP